MKIMLVFGTRPEAIKMCPLVLELKRRTGVETVVCVTGQHREQLDDVLKVFGIVPEHDLNVMTEKQTLADITQRVLVRIGEVLKDENPDAVLVHGDTTTAFAAALACFYAKIPFGHVEAGLRTHDLDAPFPEEWNRRAIDILAKWRFAPTEIAKRNLIAERADESSIFVTGNTAIDALKMTIRKDFDNPDAQWAEGSRMVLMTAHRRESIGKKMRGMFRAIRRAVDEHGDVKVVYPVHLNPEVQRIAREELVHERIRLTAPMDAITFHNMMERCCLILTDSGGIQEEAPSLGKPVLVLRDETERPEGIVAGVLKLAGTDEEKVYREFTRLLDDRSAYERMAHAENPYGDGRASERIADVLTGNCHSKQEDSMKITIEIDQEAIEQNVTDLVSNQLANELYKELRGSRDTSLTYRYHVEVRKIIREVMKESYDALAKEAVAAAAKSIENRALKEKIRAALED